MTIGDKDIKNVKKILIIQYKPFGDILLNTAYLPRLREKFPNAQIDFLIQKPYVTILEDNPNIDNLVIMQKFKKEIPKIRERIKIIFKIRKEKYDMIIDQLRGAGSAQITMFSGAKYRIGWKLKRFNWLYNISELRENIRYYGLLKFDVLKSLGIIENNDDTYYYIKPESQDKIDSWLTEINLNNRDFIVVSPCSPVIFKQWSLDLYAATLDKVIKELNLSVILLWGPNELDRVNYIAEKMKNTPIIALKTNFNEAAALLNRSKLFFGNDGGINHVAIAVKTPSVAIFGPHSNPKKWQANHKNTHTYLRNWDCKDKNDRTLGITADQAVAEIKKMLEIVR